jgi:hypothetical protein
MTVAGVRQADVGAVLTSCGKGTGCVVRDGDEETTGCTDATFVEVSAASELNDSVAERFIIAQLKSPVGLLQIGGVKHFMMTTIHNR